jgi:nicotinate phosphoribosyltransferase
MTDIATRVHNHSFRIDPIVRSVLDTDFYKLLMTQTIFRRHRETRVTFGVVNRTTRIPLAQLIDAGALKEQLDHIRTLRLSRGESTWLRGNMFYGKRQMFAPDFIAWLEGFRFPDYHLETKGDQLELTFDGPWIETTMWEIPALAVIVELYSRAVTKDMGKFELQVLYARAMARVWEKIERLQKLRPLAIADFGTRRRHGFLWQDWCVQAMMEGLGTSFLGTSNCLIALRRETEAIGTNAHELPMVYAALASTEVELKQSRYDVLADWQQDYEGNLRVILPDTFGTESFFEHAPDWIVRWTGVRIDSGDAIAGGEMAIDWWRRRGEDPATKLAIFSDGLDIDDIERLHRHFAGRIKVGFGWGTLLTNDFRGLVPDSRLDPFSIVCKVIAADGRPAVKLSDNPLKAIGPPDEIERYRRVFDAPAPPSAAVVV